MKQSELALSFEDKMQASAVAIGVLLRKARLDAKLSIADVSHVLRIPKDILRNLESGRFDALPGPTYVSGYIRSYARLVDIDHDEITGLLKTHYAHSDQSDLKPAYKFPVQNYHPPRMSALVASVAVLVALGGYAGWYMMDRAPDTMADSNQFNQVAAVSLAIEDSVTEGDNLLAGEDAVSVASSAGSDDIAPLNPDATGDQLASVDAVDADETTLPLQDQTGATQSGTAQTDLIETKRLETEIAAATVPAPSGNDMSVAPRKVTPDADEETAGTAVAGSDEKLPAVGDDSAGTTILAATDKDAVVPTLDPAASAKPGDGGEGSAFANQRDPAMEITIRAQASSWVEIVRNNGEEVMTKLMRNGDSYVVNSNDNLYLSTGNAGGLEVVFHDGTVMSVGDKGEIVRDMPLKIERLKAEL